MATGVPLVGLLLFHLLPQQGPEQRWRFSRSFPLEGVRKGRKENPSELDDILLHFSVQTFLTEVPEEYQWRLDVQIDAHTLTIRDVETAKRVPLAVVLPKDVATLVKYPTDMQIVMRFIEANMVSSHLCLSFCVIISSPFLLFRSFLVIFRFLT